MSKALAFINDKRVRDWFYQIALILLLVGITVFFVRNASENMVKAGIASGFDFLWRTSGIEVPFVLTGYTQSDDIFALFWVGVANTMLVTVIAIALATLLGFAIGAVLGILLAIAIVHNRAMDRSLMPWVIASQTIPILAIAPMIIVVLNAIGISGLMPKALIST